MVVLICSLAYSKAGGRGDDDGVETRSAGNAVEEKTVSSGLYTERRA